VANATLGGCLTRQLLVRAVHSIELPPWAVPFFVVGLWVLVSTLIAWMAGHIALLSRFPPVNEALMERFHFASGYMRLVHFGNALFVGIGPRGLHLAPNALFRPLLFRGVPCIPWPELTCIRPRADGFRGWFWGSKFEIRSLNLRFTLYGNPGRSVEAVLQSFARLTAGTERDAPARASLS